MKYVVNVEGAIVRGEQYLMIICGQGETHAGGTLSFVGGKVEITQNASDVLEETLRREIMEEVGVQVYGLSYVQSSHFIAGDDRVVDIVFLCRYETGEPRIADIQEVENILWLTAAEVIEHSLCPPWTQAAMQRVEALRQRLTW
jgi:ADP-ribose pyrophosphatase YjhB (NUDIX family)